jgi:hypothetical protein
LLPFPSGLEFVPVSGTKKSQANATKQKATQNKHVVFVAMFQLNTFSKLRLLRRKQTNKSNKPNPNARMKMMGFYK